MSAPNGLLSLPNELLIILPDFLHNIEDYTNLASTCRATRAAMSKATPNQILRLAIESSRIFFRPSPHFLVAATARELGSWARKTPKNDQLFAAKLEDGLDGMLELAKEHCGLTMDRIRELYEMRFSIINPVTNIMDQCVGNQWYRTPRYWDGGVSDAYTIRSDPSASVFHLAIYGELFGPDFESFFDPRTQVRQLSVETRLEFVKYCIPDLATFDCGDNARDVHLSGGGIDPRRDTKATGPYREVENLGSDNNIALSWILKSSRFKPHWRPMREAAGEDFGYLRDSWYFTDGNWRQRMWEACIVSQGLAGYQMMFEGSRDKWVGSVREWREKIANLEQDPARVKIGTTFTYEYPWLAGDLRVLATGYVLGT